MFTSLHSVLRDNHAIFIDGMRVSGCGSTPQFPHQCVVCLDAYSYCWYCARSVSQDARFYIAQERAEWTSETCTLQFRGTDANFMRDLVFWFRDRIRLINVGLEAVHALQPTGLA